MYQRVLVKCYWRSVCWSRWFPSLLPPYEDLLSSWMKDLTSMWLTSILIWKHYELCFPPASRWGSILQDAIMTHILKNKQLIYMPISLGGLVASELFLEIWLWFWCRFVWTRQLPVMCEYVLHVFPTLDLTQTGCLSVSTAENHRTLLTSYH